MADSQQKIEKLSFEEAYKQLEGIVERLENEPVSLEESLQLFDLGQAISKHCSQLLETAEQRLRTLQPILSASAKDDEF